MSAPQSRRSSQVYGPGLIEFPYRSRSNSIVSTLDANPALLDSTVPPNLMALAGAAEASAQHARQLADRLSQLATCTPSQNSVESSVDPPDEPPSKESGSSFPPSPLTHQITSIPEVGETPQLASDTDPQSSQPVANQNLTPQMVDPQTLAPPGSHSNGATTTESMELPVLAVTADDGTVHEPEPRTHSSENSSCELM